MAACRPGPPPVPPDAWIHGHVDAWLEAVLNSRPTALHLGGDIALAEAALRGVHNSLLGAIAASRD